jgi:hypothetical protein
MQSKKNKTYTRSKRGIGFDVVVVVYQKQKGYVT